MPCRPSGFGPMRHAGPQVTLPQRASDLRAWTDQEGCTARRHAHSVWQRTCSGDAAGCAPAAVLETRNDDTRAGLAAEHEAGLEDGEDRKTFPSAGAPLMSWRNH